MRLGCKAVCNSSYGFAGPWLELIEFLNQAAQTVLFGPRGGSGPARSTARDPSLHGHREGPESLISALFPCRTWLGSKRLCRHSRKTPQIATVFRSLVPSMRVFLRLRGFALALTAFFRHGLTSASSQVTRVGWLRSSWRQPASPRRGSLGSGGVALRAPTLSYPVEV
jgi:hypothetical protein